MKSLFELTAEFVGEHGSLYTDAAFACQPRPVLEKIITKLSAADLYRLDNILCSHGFDTDAVWKTHCQTLHLLRRGIRDEFGETDGTNCFKAVYHHKQFHSLITVLSLGHFAALCDSPTPTDMYTVALHNLIHCQKSKRTTEGNPYVYNSFLIKCARFCKKLVLNGRHVHYITSNEDLMRELTKYVENIVISPLTPFCFHHFRHFLGLLLTDGKLNQITFRGSTLSDEDLVQLLTICSGCSCYSGEDILVNSDVGVEIERHKTKMLSTLSQNTGQSDTRAQKPTNLLLSALNDPSPSCSKAENDNFNQFCEFYLQDEEMDWSLGEGTSGSVPRTGPNPQLNTSTDVSSSECDTPCLSPQDAATVPASPPESQSGETSYSLSPDDSYSYSQTSSTPFSRFISSRSVSECLSSAAMLGDRSPLAGDLPNRSRSCERLCPGSGGIQSFAMASDTGTLRAGDIIGYFLPHWSNLKRLSVSLSSGIRKNVKELVRHKQLSHLVVDTCLQDDFLADLIHLFASHYHSTGGSFPMDVLQISGCRLICSQHPQTINHKLCAVRMLDLSWNAFQRETFDLLLEFIKADTALKGLKLASCQLQSLKIYQLLCALCERGRKCILVPQGRLIFNRFETSTDAEMEELCLNDNRIEDDGCEEALTQFLLHAKSLHKLALSNVALTYTIEKCPEFVSAVGSHPSLEVLDVSNNFLGATHLKLIENVLCHSAAMKTFNFAFNHFKGEDLIQMSERAVQCSDFRQQKMDTLCLSRNLFDLEEQKQILYMFSAFAHEVKANCISVHAVPLEHAAQM